ncbi:hypothetical protein Tco_1171795, partial [Tanacetum coccineum]
ETFSSLASSFEKLITRSRKQEDKECWQKSKVSKVSSQYWKPPIYNDDDDDDKESSIHLRDIISELPLSFAIAPDFPITESLIMDDEHLNTIPETESDEENESSVKDLNLTLSESEEFNPITKSDVLIVPFVMILLLKNEGLDDSFLFPPGTELDNRFDPKEDIASNEIFGMMIHPRKNLNTVDSCKLLNRIFLPSTIPVEDSDSLMEEIDIFLAPDDSIPPGIENDDYDSEGDVLFLEELLNNDSISLPEYESVHVDFNNSPSSTSSSEKTTRCIMTMIAPDYEDLIRAREVLSFDHSTQP